jgi:hypothetical protein
MNVEFVGNIALRNIFASDRVEDDTAGGRHSIPRDSSSEISLAFSACSLASSS